MGDRAKQSEQTQSTEHGPVPGLKSCAGIAEVPLSDLRAAHRALQREHHALQAQYASLEVTSARHEAVAGRRDTFLAMLSHELRNPLSAVLSAARVLEDESDSNASERARAVLLRQATHMRRLLDDLLDVARLTQGRLTLRREPVDVRDACRGAFEALEHQITDKDLQLEMDLPEEVLCVDGDLARLQQVVVNLLSNAARFSERGGRIRLSAEGVGGCVQIRVSDEGVGIPQEMHERVFELFAQTQEGLARSNGGLGVGLTVAKRIVELHGGRIEVESGPPRKGTTMTVRLSGHSEPKENASASPSAVPANAGPTPRRVVLVEDQDDAREMFQLLLEARGHTTATAADGPAGVERVREERPDVAFVDIGLPGLDGYGVAGEVRAGSEPDDVVLVALTGYGTDEDAKRAKEAGFDTHLTKPASAEDIAAILANPDAYRRKR